MGRHKIPAELQKLRGTARADRPRASSVEVSMKITDLKDYSRVSGYGNLTPRAKRIYRRVCQDLFTAGMLQRDQLYQLIIYATEYDTYLACCEDIAKNGMYVARYNDVGDVSGTIVNPAYAIRNRAYTAIASIGAKYGFTPVDRQRIRQQAEGGSKIAEVLNVFVNNAQRNEKELPDNQ